MIYNTYELIWLFLIYRFWAGCWRQYWRDRTKTLCKQRIDQWSIMYDLWCSNRNTDHIRTGIAAVLAVPGSHDRGDSHGMGSVDHMIERFYHERWWDYSNVKWNLDGYICLPASLVWGVLGTVSMRWGNGLLIRLYGFLPEGIGHLLVWILAGMLVLDVTATIFALSGIGRSTQKWEAVDSWFTSISLRIGQWLYGHVDRRIHRAYPKTVQVEKPQRDKTVFAAGCCMQKLVWLFFIGCLLGDITETIFCRITAGVWMSRSSLVWGPFSIVWGFAIAAVTDLLYKYKDRSDRFLFLMGTALGGAYEYLCSVLQKVFGPFSGLQ